MKRKIAVALVLLLCLFMTSTCIVSADYYDEDDEEEDYEDEDYEDEDDYYDLGDYEIIGFYNGVCVVRRGRWLFECFGRSPWRYSDRLSL